MEGIGRNVRHFREEKGWNQTELAYRSKMSVSIISLIENGKRNASTNTLERIAEALGVEVVDLFPKVLPWSITVTHAGLEAILEDVEAGHTEEAASKLRELIGA